MSTPFPSKEVPATKLWPDHPLSPHRKPPLTCGLFGHVCSFPVACGTSAELSRAPAVVYSPLRSVWPEAARTLQDTGSIPGFSFHTRTMKLKGACQGTQQVGSEARTRTQDIQSPVKYAFFSACSRNLNNETF